MFKQVSGQLPPRKIAPQLELGFELGLWLVLELGGAVFLGAIILEPFKLQSW